jgi:hypothetical protein
LLRQIQKGCEAMLSSQDFAAQSASPAEPFASPYDLSATFDYFRMCLKTMRLVVKDHALQSALTLHLEQVERTRTQLLALQFRKAWGVGRPPCPVMQGAVSELVGILQAEPAGETRDLMLLGLVTRVTNRSLELLQAEARAALSNWGAQSSRGAQSNWGALSSSVSLSSPVVGASPVFETNSGAVAQFEYSRTVGHALKETESLRAFYDYLQRHSVQRLNVQRHGQSGGGTEQVAS